MKHRLILFILPLLLLPVTLRSQTVKPVEVEVRTGFTLPLAAEDGYANLLHWGMLGAEVRYNFREIPLDAGLEWTYTMGCRQSPSDENDKLPLRIWTISLTADYIFNQGEAVSWFVGIGAGPAQRLVTSPFFGEYEDVPVTGALVSPRIGVELWNQLRFTLCARITSRAFNVIEAGIGYAIGGRTYKTKKLTQDRNDPFYDPAFD